MLNVSSFSHGDQKTIEVTSWSGTTQARAQEVVLGDLAVGEHHFKMIKLPAVELSALGRACGKRIDGILGIDLLSALGATVDLKTRTAHLGQEDMSAEARAAELHRQLSGCEAAFNRADERAFAECLAPQVAIFTAGGDFYGRDASMQYYRRRYFQHDPPAHLSITPRAHHALGDAMWMEYDLRITMGPEIILARGTALCEKVEGRWRIVHMNHSSPPPPDMQAKKQD